MAYPLTIDTWTNPGAGSYTDDPGVELDVLISEHNDAIKALEANVGTGASAPAANQALIGTGTGSSAWTDSPVLAGSLTLGAVSGVPGANAQYRNNVVKGYAYYTSRTTTALLAGFNVSGVTDDGVGTTTVTWDRDFSTGNYAAVIGHSSHNSVVAHQILGQIAGSIQIATLDNANAAQDCDVSIVAIGDQ